MYSLDWLFSSKVNFWSAIWLSSRVKLPSWCYEVICLVHEGDLGDCGELGKLAFLEEESASAYLEESC